MCLPIIQNIAFDLATYSPGQTVTATVTYTACCSGPFTVAGGDSGNRAWTLISNDGISQAIFQAVA